MTISGILAGLLDPYGSAFALSGVVARGPAPKAAEAQPVEQVRGVGGPSYRQAECPVCGRSSFETEDTLELSAVPTDHEAAANAEELSNEEREQVAKLQDRDRQVREHERAHLAAAGPYALSGASFQYQIGPDGRSYVVGGEVKMDSAPVEDNPEATIRKMEHVRAAALAPADPSAQDRGVAARAVAAIQEARAELRQQEAADNADDEAELGLAARAAHQAGPRLAPGQRFVQPSHPAAALVDTYA
ncbi:MAG: putative metalloprotease CJM1_0395 family protein [Phycisphaerae bacterium]